MLKILLFLTLNLNGPLWAQSALNPGLEAFQKADYDSAQKEFSSQLKNPQWRFAALYNLGTIAAKMKKPGQALGYFRQAQNLSPRDKDLAYNIRYVINEFKIQPPTGNISSFEIFRQEFLNNFTFYELSLICFIFLISLVFTTIKYLKTRMAQAEKPFPPFTFFVWSTLFLLSFVVVIIKFADAYTERATIIVPKAELRSGPSANNAALAEVNEGSEVLVKETLSDNSGTWKQVTIPGNLTGWVSDKSLMVTSSPEAPW